MNPKGSASGKTKMVDGGQLRACFSLGNGGAILKHLSSTEGSHGIMYHSSNSVTILSGRAIFLPPRNGHIYISPIELLWREVLL